MSTYYHVVFPIVATCSSTYHMSSTTYPIGHPKMPKNECHMSTPHVAMLVIQPLGAHVIRTTCHDTSSRDIELSRGKSLGIIEKCRYFTKRYGTHLATSLSTSSIAANQNHVQVLMCAYHVSPTTIQLANQKR